MRIHVFLISLLALSGCVVAPYTRYMASDLRLRIVASGRGIEGAVITREAALQGGTDRELQSAVTNINGWAMLPAITRVGVVQSIKTWVYTQRYTVTISGREYLIWTGGKVGDGRFAERFPDKLSALLEIENGEFIYVFDIDKHKEPNKSPEPTPTSVMPAAEAAVPPAAVVAHL